MKRADIDEKFQGEIIDLVVLLRDHGIIDETGSGNLNKAKSDI
jgi:hypothetical protein